MKSSERQSSKPTPARNNITAQPSLPSAQVPSAAPSRQPPPQQAQQQNQLFKRKLPPGPVKPQPQHPPNHPHQSLEQQVQSVKRMRLEVLPIPVPVQAPQQLQPQAHPPPQPSKTKHRPPKPTLSNLPPKPSPKAVVTVKPPQRIATVQPPPKPQPAPPPTANPSASAQGHIPAQKRQPPQQLQPPQPPQPQPPQRVPVAVLPIKKPVAYQNPPSTRHSAPHTNIYKVAPSSTRTKPTVAAPFQWPTEFKTGSSSSSNEKTEPPPQQQVGGGGSIKVSALLDVEQKENYPNFNNACEKNTLVVEKKEAGTTVIGDLPLRSSPLPEETKVRDPISHYSLYFNVHIHTYCY